MEGLIMEHKLSKLRSAIAELRDSLDEAEGRIVRLGAMASKTAEEAHGLTSALGGRSSGGLLGLGLWGILGLGVVGLALFSPRTLTGLSYQIRGFFASQREHAGEVADQVRWQATEAAEQVKAQASSLADRAKSRVAEKAGSGQVPAPGSPSSGITEAPTTRMPGLGRDV
jgi:Sec-independent protein translocase protein TatA